MSALDELVEEADGVEPVEAGLYSHKGVGVGMVVGELDDDLFRFVVGATDPGRGLQLWSR